MNRHVSDFTLQKKSSCKTKRSHAITWLWIIRTVGSGPRSLAIGGWLFRLMRPLNIIRPAFLVLLLSETVLSETVLVLDGCLNYGDVLHIGPAAQRLRTSSYDRSSMFT